MILPFVEKILPFEFGVCCADYNQAAYWMYLEQKQGQNGTGNVMFSTNIFFKTAVSLSAKDVHLALSTSPVCFSLIDHGI